MSREFTAFELAATALLLDRELAQHDPETAFAKAREFLDRASEFQNASVAPEPGFLEGIEADIPADLGGQKDRAAYEAEVEKVKEGGRSNRVLILNRGGGASSFGDYLKERGAPKELQRLKFSGHQQRIDQHQINYERVNENGELASIIISKENVDTYLDLEKVQIRAADRERKRKSRQNKTQRDKPIIRRKNCDFFGSVRISVVT